MPLKLKKKCKWQVGKWASEKIGLALYVSFFWLTRTPKKGTIFFMNYNVVMKKKLEKGVKKLPLWVQKKLVALVLDLKEKGPEQPKWQNYSKLSSTEYHCHLGTSWAACWRHQKKTITIEVYYVGSREKAPY